MNLRRLQLVLLLPLLAASAELRAGSLVGQVRDSAGKPQIGAEVQLLAADQSVISRVYTNAQGRYLFDSIPDGRYALKAMGSFFLPSLRENLRVHARTTANLTLSTLYEALTWLPARRRSPAAAEDDWTWTLRSAANRPLLRWLEDGPLVVVTESAGARPRLKARLVAIGEEGSFGEDGERISASLQMTPAESRELLAQVDFSPGSNAAMESMLGFRQDLGIVGSVQTVAAVALHPEFESGAGDGLDELAVRTAERLDYGPVAVEAGSTQMVASLGGVSPQAHLLPFANLSLRAGANGWSYNVATALPADKTGAGAGMPLTVVHDGRPEAARGLHQQLGWQMATVHNSFELALFVDRLSTQPLTASVRHLSHGALSDGALYDPIGSLLRLTASTYNSTGAAFTYDRQLGQALAVELGAVSGNALVLPARPAATLEAAAAQAHPRRTQSFALSLSGTLEGTHTRWRASYRWQPSATLSPASAWAAQPPAYFALNLRQPLGHHVGSDGLDFFLDLRNLFAEGYRPMVLEDGSVVLFTAQPRSIRAGLGFSF